MKILILEDNEFDSDLTKRQLLEDITDAQIDIATNIKRAKASIVKNNYDVALLDLKLPDGFGTNILTDLLKSNEQMVVIMLTGSGDEEIAVAALKSGADDYILKKQGYLLGLSKIIDYHISEKRRKRRGNNEPIHVLFLEHHASDIDLTLYHFKRFAPQFKFKTVNKAEQVLDLLPKNLNESLMYQMVLMDYKLPGMSAFELIKVIRQERKLDIPIIIVTGQGNEEVAILALKMGVDEYLVKRENYLYRLPSLLMSAYQKYLLEKQKNELIESESRYRMLANNAGDVIFTLDLDLNYTFISPSVYQLRGYTPEEVLKQNIANSLTPESYANAMKLISETLSDAVTNQNKLNDSVLLVLEMVRKNKTKVWTEVKASMLTDENNNPIGILGVTRDISKRKEAEINLNQSREEYKKFFDDDLTGDFLSSVDGKLLNCNPAYLSILGFSSKEEALQYDLIKLYKSPFTRKNLIRKLTEKKRLINFEFEMVRTDGVTISVISNIVGIYTKKNELESLRGYLIDNTERKHAMDNLRKLSKAVEQSPASIVITDTSGNIEYVNPKFCKISGYSVDELIGKNPSILKTDNTSKEAYETLWKTVLSGNEWVGEFYNRKKDASFYWEQATISPIKNREGEITHIVGIKEDITERKKILNELILAKEKAVESDNLKTAFLANMSHEIRTPMNAVLGFSDLLLKENIKPEEKQLFAEYIRVNGENLVKIIDDIIEISKIQSKQLTISEREFNLHMLFNELELYYNSLLIKKTQTNLSLNKKLHHTNQPEFYIKTDGHRLKQVLNNLLTNAIKYTNEGTITFGYKIVNRHLHFFVTDTGQGIPEAQQKQIFDRFFQYSKGFISRQEGTGLGLSISKELVSLLGGELKVDSVEGVGSTFYFDIPLKIANESIIPKDEIQEQPVFQDLSKFNILIADDEESNYVLTKRMLHDTKVGTQWARNGKIAVEMADAKNFDLVLMDIKMPEMDGIEATRLIKKSNKKLPVIIQTAFAMSEAKNEAIAAGCNDFIVKPIGIDDFMRLVNKFIQSDLPQNEL